MRSRQTKNVKNNIQKFLLILQFYGTWKLSQKKIPEQTPGFLKKVVWIIIRRR
jgi:hypothetical protein